MTPRLLSIGWPWNLIAWFDMSKLTERWRLCYTQSTEDDTVLDLDLNFENVSDEVLAQRIATFLAATGRTDMAKIEKPEEQ